jgi:hypothetical protein
MFTNKYSRTKQSNRQQYIEPFDEADTAPGAAKPAGNGFMAELDQWLDEAVFEPIERAIASEDSKELHIAFSESKQHIKRKVLASYHNGLKAKTPTNQKNYGQQTYRRN